jgi:hypothetical protein
MTDSDSAGLTTVAILEDFVAIGLPRLGARLSALLSADANPEFIRRVQAAALSVQMGISLSYAEKRYVPPEIPKGVTKSYILFQSAYRTAVEYVSQTMQKWKCPPDETEVFTVGGTVFSNVALRRLEGTFRAAGLLFRIGYLFEARAVARTILEQVAWSYVVRDKINFAQASKLSPTACISDLKKLLPHVGRLYGDLSAETHLGIEQHTRFMKLDEDVPKVLLCHGAASWDSGVILLELADLWAVVFECSQRVVVHEPECWLETANGLELKFDRPMVKAIERLRAEARNSAPLVPP